MDEKSSSFQSLILEIARKNLNMMLCETFQLKEDVDFSNYEKLTKIILREIARGNIDSPHLTQKQAQGYIKLIETFTCRMEIGNGLKPSIDKKYPEYSNPFYNSPLN